MTATPQSTPTIPQSLDQDFAPDFAPDLSQGLTTPAETETPQPVKVLTPAAQRALAEAAARRAERDAMAQSQPVEINGRGGLDPARYGDWEVKGLTSDF